MTPKGKKHCWMFELIAMFYYFALSFFTVQDNMKEHSDQGVATWYLPQEINRDRKSIH